MFVLLLACHPADSQPDSVPDTDTELTDSDVPCEPPIAGPHTTDWDLAAWLAAHPKPETPTSQSGHADPMPFTLAPGEREAFRTAWDAMVGPIPRSCLPLDLRDEPLDLSTPEQAGLDTTRYSVRKISYQGAHGARIPAYLLVPAGLAGPAPGVLVMHQSNQICGKKEPLGVCGAWNLDFARDLAERGIVTLAPDSIGYGERAHLSWYVGYEYPDAAPLLAAFPDSTLMGLRVSDVDRGIDALQSLPEVDPARVGMIGHSNGGIETLMNAAFDDRIGCAVSNAGPNLVRRETYDFLGMTPGIARWAGYGYLPAMGFWNDDLAGLPIETHQLYALVAPRDLYVALMEDDTIAPAYDRIDFAFGEAERAFSAEGGDFVGHRVATGITPECVDEWGAPVCLDALYAACVASGNPGCIQEFADAGIDDACLYQYGSAMYCAHALWWACRQEGRDAATCLAPFDAVGGTARCAADYGVIGCRRDHGWYPEVEAEAYPWLIGCLSR